MADGIQPSLRRAIRLLVLVAAGCAGASLPSDARAQSPSAANFAWTVKPPPGELSLCKDSAIDIGIAVQGVPATDVRVMQTALIEQSTKFLIPGNWSLCRTHQGQCDTKIDLGAHSANRLWLRPTDRTSIIGKYTGTVTIGASEKPDGETFNLTVYGTTPSRQILGGVVIAVGVVLAWISTTWFQNRINRAQMLLPATALRERVELLQRRFSAAAQEVGADVPKTSKKLEELRYDLSDRGLDGQRFLQPRFPVTVKGMAPSADADKEYLAKRTQNVALLEALVERGFEQAWKMVPRPLDKEKLASLQTATASLDALAEEDIPNTTVLAEKIGPILRNLRTQLGRAELAEEGPPAEARPPTFEQLTVEIRNFSLMTWAVFAILATALGTYILVILNLGFGVLSDYFVCLFWGFGLPVGGQQLAQSTIGSVSTVLGVPVPKSD